MLCDRELGVTEAIAPDPHDERILTLQGPGKRHPFASGARKSLELTPGDSVLTLLLHNQEQSAKANKKRWGDKSIGNTQSQQFTVEQVMMSFERRRKPAQSERQQPMGGAQNPTAGKHQEF